MAKKNAEVKSGSVSAAEVEAAFSQDAETATQTVDSDVDVDLDDDSFFTDIDDGSMSLNDLSALEADEPKETKEPEPTVEEVVEDESAPNEPTHEPVKKTEPKHEFDKDRQQEQIALANTRRLLQERELEIQQMKEAMLKKKISPPVDKDEQPLDLDDPDLDPIELLKRQNEAMRRQESEIAEINRRLTIYSQLEAKRLADARAQEVSSMYDHFFKQMDSKYGAENRNAAKQYAQEFAREAGYTLNPNEENGVPSMQETLSYIRAGFIQARADAAQQGSQTLNKPKARQDVAKTGRTVAADTIKEGRFEDVMADMKKDGYFERLFTKKG